MASHSGSWITRSLGTQAVAYVAATRARDAAKDIVARDGKLDWRDFRRHHALVRKRKWHRSRASLLTWRATKADRQSDDDITHADLAGNLLGGVYANGIAWFVEPDADTAIAFVQEATSKTYRGAMQVTRALRGTTELDAIYKGSTQVF